MENLKKLKEVCAIQCSDGNWNYSQYMRGLANGLILALAIMEDKKPEYLEDIKEYLINQNEPVEQKGLVNIWEVPDTKA